MKGRRRDAPLTGRRTLRFNLQQTFATPDGLVPWGLWLVAKLTGFGTIAREQGPTRNSGTIARMSDPIRLGEPSADWRPTELILYFLLAYGISLALWLPVFLGRGSRPDLQVGTFGPTLAALITNRVFAGNWRAGKIWTTLRKSLLGIASGAAIVLISAFTAAFFMTRSGIDRWQWPALQQILTLFFPNLLGGPLGEELG